MNYNAIYMVAIDHDNSNFKHSNFSEYSIKSWEYWCKKNNVDFHVITEHNKDYGYPIWNKLDVVDVCDKYEYVGIVDCDTMIKWDAPNIFEQIDDRFVAWNDLDNLKWVYDSVKGYEPFFNFELDMTKYVNSGVIIFNKSHRNFFESFKQLYLDNSEKFIILQDKEVRKGTEQTPFNYWLQKNEIELNLEMPVTWKLTHLHRKEMLGPNWQLKEDNIPFFIKHGYLWFFTGFEKMQRSQLMTQVWNMVKHNYEA